VVEDSVVKLIQICASRNDLFGLDDEGGVYQYNFNTSIWMALGRRRSADLEPPSASFETPPGSRRPRDTAVSQR
jgi:hypothetical protein